MEIPPFVVALTGISNEMVAVAPAFEEVADKIFTLTEGKIFVAHDVKFDYTMIRNEFKRLGRKYQRRHLCTVKMSQKVFNGLTTFSLGKLCKTIGIPVDSRHRAYGDAEATAQLFERILLNDRGEMLHSFLKSELEEANFPVTISKQQVDQIPEEAGVYYFVDENGKPLYIGKSKDIRGRVISHFSRDTENVKFQKLKQQVHDINYEVTGSELIALLLENSEIKRYWPPFNSMQRGKKYRYGVYQGKSKNGFMTLQVKMLNPEKEPILKLTTRRSVEHFLERIIESYDLVPELCGFEIDRSFSLKNISPKSYNANVRKVIYEHRFKPKSFLLITEGRTLDERSVVWVENHAYKGFGFFHPDKTGDDIEKIKEATKAYPDNPEARRIIKRWLRKKRKSDTVTKL